jgi:hypothetical protein
LLQGSGGTGGSRMFIGESQVQGSSTGNVPSDVGLLTGALNIFRFS